MTLNNRTIQSEPYIFLSKPNQDQSSMFFIKGFIASNFDPKINEDVSILVRLEPQNFLERGTRE